MRKKVLSVLLCTAMAATMLTGCGGSSDEGASSGASSGTASSSSATASKADVSNGGKVLNIRCWNEEFKTRLENLYPGYEITGKKTGKIGDVTVKWNIVPSTDNAYQNALDEALLAQADAKADDKVDLFLVEADYALKYVDADASVDVVNDLGLTEDDLSQQYDYTKKIVTDSNGALKGVSWQGCPGLMIYNRDIAKKVYGSDKPEDIQAKFGDWTAFENEAKTLKDNGYNITSSVNDTYRVFSNNVTSKWVEDGKINVDDNIKAWADMSKNMVDAKETGTSDLWSDDWNKGFMEKSSAFCYFGPAWLIDFCMKADEKGSVANAGKWAVTQGPQSFYWGGTWICGANGTDNADLVKDIMQKMTCDKDTMIQIVKKYNDFANNKGAMDEMASDKKFGNKILGGQNPIPLFCENVEKIDLSNLTSYDQTCTEEFQKAMKDYFEGNASYDDALATFYKNVETKHSELTH